MERRVVSHETELMTDSAREAARRYREKDQAMARWHGSAAGAGTSGSEAESKAGAPEEARTPIVD
jgi:hypothetical protein